MEINAHILHSIPYNKTDALMGCVLYVCLLKGTGMHSTYEAVHPNSRYTAETYTEIT